MLFIVVTENLQRADWIGGDRRTRCWSPGRGPSTGSGPSASRVSFTPVNFFFFSSQDKMMEQFLSGIKITKNAQTLIAIVVDPANILSQKNMHNKLPQLSSTRQIFCFAKNSYCTFRAYKIALILFQRSDIFCSRPNTNTGRAVFFQGCVSCFLSVVFIPDSFFSFVSLAVCTYSFYESFAIDAIQLQYSDDVSMVQGRK